MFNPINTTARYGGGATKAWSDVLSILAFVLIGLLAFAICLIAFGNALAITLAHATAPGSAWPWWKPLVSWPERLMQLGVSGLLTAAPAAVKTGLGRLGSSITLLWDPYVHRAAQAALAGGRPAAGDRGRGCALRRASVPGMFLDHKAARRAFDDPDPAEVPQTRDRRAHAHCDPRDGGMRAVAVRQRQAARHGRALAGIVRDDVRGSARRLSTTFIANFFGDVQIYCIARRELDVLCAARADSRRRDENAGDRRSRRTCVRPRLRVRSQPWYQPSRWTRS